MSLPRFSAEASLSKANEFYQLTTEWTDFTARQTVIPQDCYYYGRWYRPGDMICVPRWGYSVRYWCNVDYWQALGFCW